MAWDDTKIEDGGETADGRLSAAEYNALVAYVKTSRAPLRWGWEGDLTVASLFRHEIRESCTIKEAYASVKTAPTGASLLVQVYKVSDPTVTPTTTDSIFSSDTPITIAAGNTSATGILDSERVSCSAGDVLIVAVTQIGSTVAGKDLYVQVSFS
jgi:hypothetical protein